MGSGSRYFVSGAQPLLDQPGEWYFNQSTHTLYYHPPAGFTGSGAVVPGTRTSSIFPMPITSRFKVLVFPMPAPTRLVDFITTAAVNINSSTGVVVDGYKFANVAQGVLLSGSSNNNTVSSNT